MPTVKLLVFSLFLAVFLSAQSGTSGISGLVKDPTGSVVAGANIKITNEENGTSTTQQTNDAGLFRAGSLLPGAYRIDVETPGFDKLTRRPVTVEVGQTISLDLILQVGKAAESLVVEEAAPLVD